MRLAELPVGTGILFDVSIQKQELEFPSEVVEVHDNFILTKPVMSKGKVVGLGGEGVSVSLTYSRNDKAPIVWKGVGCSVVKTKGRVLYKVIASGAGFEVKQVTMDFSYSDCLLVWKVLHVLEPTGGQWMLF